MFEPKATDYHPPKPVIAVSGIKSPSLIRGTSFVAHRIQQEVTNTFITHAISYRLQE